MSTKSPYIEHSKHPQFTRAVEGHFMNGEDPRSLVDVSPIDGSKYGSNEQLPFNTPDTGINYVAPNRAGHKTK